MNIWTDIQPTEVPLEDSNLIKADKHTISYDCRHSNSIIFGNNLAVLSLTDNKITFNGDVDQASEIFFNEVIKKMKAFKEQ